MNRTSKSCLAALLGVVFAITAASAHEGHRHTAKGTVKAVTADRLELETTEGTMESFALTAATKVLRGDAAAQRESVAVGERAVVEYEVKASAKNALEIRLASSTATSQALVPSGFSLVETKKVCMVNDRVFPNEQIPVEVGGKTYYGCCPMCKERLASDVAARTAVDPVSGKPVDKALALIVARPDGTVLYFENAETLSRYRSAGG